MQENNDLNNVIKTGGLITLAKYKRCSTDNQELNLQDEILNKYIKRLQEDNPTTTYNILDFGDYAISGKTIERKALKRLIDLIEKGKINIVIFTKLDRLARSLQDLLNLTSIFDKNGVKFVSVEQNLDTSTYQGRLSFQIMGAFAEFERNITRERMESGRKRAELLGTKSGKPCHRPSLKIDRDGVIYKYKEGRSMRSIAKLYNVSITPIRKIILELDQYKDIKRKILEDKLLKFKDIEIKDKNQIDDIT